MVEKAIHTSERIMAQVREECGPKTLLSFSRGKDSIGAWIALNKVFDEVVLYHLYLVPGLEFVEESLDYYRRTFGVKIYSLPHPSLYRWLNHFVFTDPSYAAVISAARLPDFDYLDIHKIVAEAEGLKWNKVYTGTGVRAADSPQRRVAMENHGPVNREKRTLAAIWDWNKARLVDEITRSGILLPIDYKYFGRSFDGLDLRFIYQIKQHFPNDYRTILKWFPLVNAEMVRHELYGSRLR